MCAVCEKRQIGPDGHRIVAPMSATASRVPPMISAASAPVPWQDTAQGVGTLLAVFVAVAAFLWEALRARRLEKERDVALAQQARRDQRAAAGAVFALVVDRYTPDAERSSYTREALVHVGNEGNHPVFNVMVSVGVGFYTRTIGPLSVPKPIPVMPARQTLTWDITVPLAAHDDTQSPTAQFGPSLVSCASTEFQSPRGRDCIRHHLIPESIKGHDSSAVRKGSRWTLTSL